MDKKQVNKKNTAAAAGTSVERKPRSVSKDSAGGRGKGSAQKINAGGAKVAGKSSVASKSKSPAGKNRKSVSKGKQGASAKKGASGKGKASRSKSSGKEETKGGKKGDKKKQSSEDEEDKEETKEERKPPKAIGTYIYFNTAMTKKIKEEEGLPHKEAFSKAGQMWKSATEEEKKPFEAQHLEDVKRYEAQLKMLKEKGYFMIDGVKSTDLEDKSAKKKKAKSGDVSKSGKKRASGASVGKSKAAGKAAKPDAKKATAAAASGKKQSKKSDDEDLDIEDEASDEIEQSD